MKNCLFISLFLIVIINLAGWLGPAVGAGGSWLLFWAIASLIMMGPLSWLPLWLRLTLAVLFPIGLAVWILLRFVGGSLEGGE
jgi:hypothetical protein